MGVPDEAARLSILKVLTSRLRLAGDFDMEELARRTPGYVGACEGRGGDVCVYIVVRTYTCIHYVILF